MKSINDDEHIKTDFGYIRLDIRYKQCVRCRTKGTEHENNNIEHAREMYKIYYETNQEQKLAYNAEIIECDVCGKSLRRECLKQHKAPMNCESNLSNVMCVAKKYHIKQKTNILIHLYVKEQEL